MKLINFTLPILLLAGCAGKPEAVSISSQISEEGNIVLDISEPMSAEWQRLENYIESLRVIPLETSSESVMSMVWGACAGKQSIFVKDNKQVMVFGLDGHLIKALPSGQGPEEYIGAYRIKYLPQEDCFYLCDNHQDKIIKYDGLGNYIAHYPAPIWSTDFLPTGDGFIYFQDMGQNEEKEHLIILTDTLAEVRNIWTLGPGVSDSGIINNFQQVDGEIAFSLPCGNQIYTYKDGAISKRYQISYDGMPEVDYSQRPRYGELARKFPDSYFLTQGVFESRNYLFICMYSEHSASNEIFYNKNTKKFFRRYAGCTPESLLTFICQNFLGVSGPDGETFVGVVDPVDLLDDNHIMGYGWDGSNPGGLIPEADMARLRNVKPDDNPIIVLFKLKSEI